MHVKPHPQFPQIFIATLEDGSQKLATRNLAPGRTIYGEKLIRFEGVEYRLWDPFRSKLAAAILKGIKTVPIEPDHQVLYLGAASGTTASHVSDIVGEKGYVYCVEFAARAIRELVNNVCAYRVNMLPILEDARFPEKYAMFIRGKVDDIYCDLAQPEQARILADNAEMFLKHEGYVMLAIKARSIDVTKEPSEVYKREIGVLRDRGFDVLQVVNLEPYEVDHVMVLAKLK
ncbi:fibrillarin-like rRNA/tRNA 2'-O-methyltransferase [Candidatus Bathyarchaeota archaeon]|nr:fibrillarin-like rRNA/tRNA 2'-O-methyltransferase [Candidatus Bathyarchaeota archaeon]